MVLALLRHAHDGGGSILGHLFSRPPFGLHDGVRLGKVSSPNKSIGPITNPLELKQ